MAMPERIWMPPYDGNLFEARGEGFTQFIRADLVDDLVKALEEAREMVEHWADVASRADRTRYDTSDDLASIDAALNRLKEK